MTDSPVWTAAPWSERRSGASEARPSDWRAWHDRDRARIIHCSAFRRLQNKTQVLGIGGSDFHRTRLTHSLETAQIAQGVVNKLSHDADLDPEARSTLPPPALIEAVALAHDLGHPPFGHGGEAALDACMAADGGFEGNAQTLRLIARLEAHSDEFGLDLARRTMLGVLKYPLPRSKVLDPASDGPGARSSAQDRKPAKCFYDAELPIAAWLLEPFDEADRRLLARSTPAARSAGGPDHRAFDTTILELADDIAYGVHDLEDAIALRLLDREHVEAAWRAHRAGLADMTGAPADQDVSDLFSDESSRKRAIGLLVNFFIVHVRAVRTPDDPSPLLAWSARMEDRPWSFLQTLKTLVGEQVIKQPVVQMLEYRGQEIVRRLFATIGGDPERFLPAVWRERWHAAADAHAGARTVCDYVAAMTDEQATRNYELLFAPRGGLSFGVQ